MKKKPTLLILAAGMGSRYGGLKQMDPFGPNGETIIDYSIYDAIRAGFGKVVFIIREHFKKDFQNLFDAKLKGKIETVYVTQELANLPDGYTLPEERTKPWGTAHAVLVAQDMIDEPFAVINADDYYGRNAYQTLADFFSNPQKAEKETYAVVAYLLKNTLSEHGTVNRGVCMSDADGYLQDIVETLKIAKTANDEGVYTDPESNEEKTLVPDTLVSMNMFGFLPSWFDKTNEYFKQFLDKRIKEEKSEFFIPLALDNMISENFAQIKVLSSADAWFGVTYKEDKPFVVGKINELIQSGVYPEDLWA